MQVSTTYNDLLDTEYLLLYFTGILLPYIIIKLWNAAPGQRPQARGGFRFSLRESFYATVAIATTALLVHGMHCGSDLEIDSGLVIIALVAGAEMVESESITKRLMTHDFRK